MKHLLLTTIAATLLIGCILEKIFGTLPMKVILKKLNSTWTLVLMLMPRINLVQLHCILQLSKVTRISLRY